jgi:predicted metal-dependent enzyme (double-stranded beta helix superfamily)
MVSVSLAAKEVGELGTLSELPPEPGLREAVAFLTRLLGDRAFLDGYALPLLGEAAEADEWYVAHCWEGEDGSYSLQVFVWPPGTKTQIHDHSSWGAYRCAVGSVHEERYERLDDGSRLEHARLKKVWRLSWSPEDGASTVLPGAGGIHRIGNPGAKAAISVHLYGPRLGEVDGHDYDPSRDHVCDRVDA